MTTTTFPAAGAGEPISILIVVNSPTSGPGNLTAWFTQSGAACTVVDDADIPASADGYDAAVLLGGGLLPYDDDVAPWLARERRLARHCLDRGIPILGVCFGAQLLAAVAGGATAADWGAPERGAIAIRRRPDAATDALLAGLDDHFWMLQNHKDQIVRLPSGAAHLAETDACPVQAFRLRDTAWGVQFHPEAPITRIGGWDPDSLAREGLDISELTALAEANHASLLTGSRLLAHNFVGVVAETARSRRISVIDGHNDLAWELRVREFGRERFVDGAPELHTDLSRMRAGGMGGQFWSVWVPDDTPDPARIVREQIDRVHRLIDYPGSGLAFTPTADDIRAAMDAGDIACLLGAEGAHCLESDLHAVAELATSGVRYMTLTHNAANEWADSATDEPTHNGLSGRGAQLVAELERCGVLVDISHVSAKTMADVLDIARAPVIFSHSSCRAVHPHPRNVPDEVLGRLAANGGVQMVTFVPQFLAPSRRRATLFDAADHVEHARAVAGISHIGLGGDFDGISTTPEGLPDVSAYPALLSELRRRGWTRGELAALASENILRVLDDTDAAFSRNRAVSPKPRNAHTPRLPPLIDRKQT